MTEPHPMWRKCAHPSCRVLFKDAGFGIWDDMTWWCSPEHRAAGGSDD